jgi:hypothetical protein
MPPISEIPEILVLIEGRLEGEEEIVAHGGPRT